MPVCTYTEHSIVEKIHLDSLIIIVEGIIRQNTREFAEIKYTVNI